jgi:hypothetical protein
MLNKLLDENIVLYSTKEIPLKPCISFKDTLPHKMCGVVASNYLHGPHVGIINGRRWDGL